MITINEWEHITWAYNKKTNLCALFQNLQDISNAWPTNCFLFLFWHHFIRHASTSTTVAGSQLKLGFDDLGIEEAAVRSCFIKISVLENFAIFRGKHLCWNLIRLQAFIKNRLQYKCFPVNIVKLLRTAFFI